MDSYERRSLGTLAWFVRLNGGTVCRAVDTGSCAPQQRRKYEALLPDVLNRFSTKSCLVLGVPEAASGTNHNVPLQAEAQATRRR